MPWPQWWSSTKKDDITKKEPSERVKDAIDSAIETGKSETASIAAKAASSKLSAFTQPQTLIATTVLTAACLGSFRFYRSYLRRFPEAINIKPSFFRKRSIVGKVTSVGDGDNFRIFHTPGGKLAGWGWLRKIPDNVKDLRHRTIHIRLAGVDAPEMAHFGRPAQPYGKEALDWLNDYLLGRRIRAYVHKPDQYSRVVATTYVWRGLFRRDVGLQMLRAGMATVYEAKTGVEFGEGLEQKYRNAEWWAKKKRKGMWAGKKEDFESPREYKNRHQNDTKSTASE